MTKSHLRPVWAVDATCRHINTSTWIIFLSAGVWGRVQKDPAEVRQAAAVAGMVPLAPEVRHLCASRLLSLLGSSDSGARSAEGADGGPAAQHSSAGGAVAEVAQLVKAAAASKAAVAVQEGAASHDAVLQTLQSLPLQQPQGGNLRPDPLTAAALNFCSGSMPIGWNQNLLQPGVHLLRQLRRSGSVQGKLTVGVRGVGLQPLQYGLSSHAAMQ